MGGCLQKQHGPAMQHGCNASTIVRPLRGRLKQGGRSAFVCKRQLPLSRWGMIKFWSSMTVGRMAGEHYFIWIRASLVWKSPDSSWYPRAHAWKIIGYDLQKWKVIGNSVHRTTYHPIPLLCKMISEIRYSFTLSNLGDLVRYKYCLFVDIDISPGLGLYIYQSGLSAFRRVM